MRVLNTGVIAMCLAAPVAHAETASVIHSFPSNVQVAGGIIAGPDGTLYGQLSFGGGQGCTNGCIYALAPPASGATKWTYTILHTFATNPGFGGVTRAADGKLYGVASDANNIASIFTLAPPAQGQSAWTYTTLITLPSDVQANSFNAQLIVNGTTITGIAEGGSTNCPYSGCGSLFQVSPNAVGAWAISALFAFNGDTFGGTPVGLVGPDAAGGYYVANGFGNRVIYATLNNGAFTTSVVSKFGAKTPGCLVLAGGNIFGVASMVVGGGNLFEITPVQGGDWTTTILLKHAAGGFSPCTEIAGPNGSLLGVTGSNPDAYSGSAFQITPPAGQGGWTYSTLFQYGRIGRDTSDNIVFGYQGDLYSIADQAYGPSAAIIRLHAAGAPQTISP